MSTSLLAIDYMFARSVGANTSVLAAAANKNTKRFDKTLADNPFPCDVAETAKRVPKRSSLRLGTPSDNDLTNARKEAVEKPPKNFRNTYRNTIIAGFKSPRKSQHSTKSKQQGLTVSQIPSPTVSQTPGPTVSQIPGSTVRQTPGPTVRPAAQPNLVQQWLAQYSLTVEQSREGVATKVMPKAGYELGRTLAKLKADKFPSPAGEAAKPADIKLLLTTDKGKIGLKTVLPATDKHSLATDNQSGKNKNAGKVPANTQSGKSKTAGKVQVSDKGLVATKAITNQQDGEKLTHEMLKTTTAGKKPAVTDQPAVSKSRKTPPLSESLPTTNGKPSDSEPKILFSQEKAAAPAVEKPTDNKTDVSRHGRIFSESAGGNGKEQDGKSSSDSILKNLNPAQVQISAGQTKDSSSSTSNNSSNSAFEQRLPFSNAQTTVAEPTFVSPTSVKTAGNVSPNDVSASIGQQIQESIHNSLRQGDQQITIRLNPPELGKVFIKFREHQGQITGLLEVSKAQTRAEIQQILPQIIRNLADCGIQIKRLEVMPAETNQPEQQTFKDQLLQDGSFQQNGFTERGNPDSGRAGTDEWLANDSSYQDSSEQKMLITDDSINMLV